MGSYMLMINDEMFLFFLWRKRDIEGVLEQLHYCILYLLCQTADNGYCVLLNFAYFQIVLISLCFTLVL